MNKTRIVIGLTASLGFGIAVACGGSSSNNGNNGGGAGNDASPGNASSSSSSGGTPGSSGGTGCTSGQSLCIALLGSSTCIDNGATCLGTSVMANECSATSPCPGGQVCCSSYVGPDGGILLYPDASADAATAGGTAALTPSVAVQCMTQCPTDAVGSSQVCSLDAEGGSAGPACPQGTTCQALPAFLTSQTLPSDLCLPMYDGGGYPGYPTPDGSTGGSGHDASSTTPVTEAAAPVADATAD